jgi:hypothetical protein
MPFDTGMYTTGLSLFFVLKIVNLCAYIEVNVFIRTFVSGLGKFST